MTRVSENDGRDPAEPDRTVSAGDPDGPPPEGSHASAVDPDAPAEQPDASWADPEDDTQPISHPDSDSSRAPGSWPPPAWPGASEGPPTSTYPEPIAPVAPVAYPDAAYPQASPTDWSQPAARTVPGWLWPSVAAMALVVGLLGGTLGGVAVSRSLSDGSIDGPVLGGDAPTLAPLAEGEGGVAGVAQQLLPSTVQILARSGADGSGATGSGFVLDTEGHVITNNHVVADATDEGQLTVVDNEGKRYDAVIVGRSAVYDIAVLNVAKADRLTPAALGSSRAMRVGESVVAIGSPLGLSSTVTSGIISALDRPVTTGGASDESSFINAVQTDAAINPGNSGGPLVNLRGEVVGVNSAIATTGGTAGGESGNIGVGFAIPMEQVRVTAAQILSTGEAKYPIIGANVDTRTTAGLGAVVKEVPSGTPADRAGLEEGDIVTAVDGTPVNDGIGLIVAIRTHQPGESVAFSITRDGAARQLSIRLDAKVG